MHENYDFQDENESTTQDQISKELLLEDTFKFLLSNESSTSSFIEALQKIYRSSLSKVVHSKFFLLLSIWKYLITNCMLLKLLVPTYRMKDLFN